MKSIRFYFTAFITVIYLSGCVPPGTDSKTGSSSGPLGNMTSIIFMGMIILVFWLFFIRPQSKKQKQQKKFIEDLQKGDKIVTIAGIHGSVNKINEDGTLSLEVSPGSYIKIEKSAISMEWTNNLKKALTGDKK